MRRCVCVGMHTRQLIIGQSHPERREEAKRDGGNLEWKTVSLRFAYWQAGRVFFFIDDRCEKRAAKSTVGAAASEQIALLGRKKLNKLLGMIR